MNLRREKKHLRLFDMVCGPTMYEEGDRFGIDYGGIIMKRKVFMMISKYAGIKAGPVYIGSQLPHVMPDNVSCRTEEDLIRTLMIKL